MFGGVFVGVGVAITFLGGGSTGGVDVLVFIICAKTKAKESIVSFAIDASIILLSIILIHENFMNSLCGVVSAFMASLMIEFIYVNQTASIQADVISNEWEQISRFAQDELGRGATILAVTIKMKELFFVWLSIEDSLMLLKSLLQKLIRKRLLHTLKPTQFMVKVSILMSIT